MSSYSHDLRPAGGPFHPILTPDRPTEDRATFATGLVVVPALIIFLALAGLFGPAQAPESDLAALAASSSLSQGSTQGATLDGRGKWSGYSQ